MKILYGIKAKTVIYTIIPVIISFLIICSILFVSLFNANQNTAKAEFVNIVRKHTKIFENKINNVIDYLSFAASVLEFHVSENMTDREALQKLLFNIFDTNGGIDGSSIYFEPDMYDGKDAEYKGTRFGTSSSGRICFYYYRADGKTNYLSESKQNDEEFSCPHYIDVKTLNAPVYTDPVEFNLDGEKIFMFFIVYPIRGRNNEFIGAITADIYLKGIYAQFQSEEVYESGNVVITNDNGRIIYSSRFNDIGKTREEAGLVRAVPSRPVSAVQTQTEASSLNSSNSIIERSEIFKIKSIFNNKDTLISRETIFFPKLNSRYYFSVVMPFDEINSAGNKLLAVILTYIVFVMIMISFLLYYIVGRMTKPLKEFKEVADVIAHGNYHIRVNGSYHDEYAVLKDTVNLMAVRIEESMEESKRSLRILKNILNGIDAFIYVTVPETGEILFINEPLKKVYNLRAEDGVGVSCYKMFRNLDEKCDFCPCHKLDKNPDVPVVWEETLPELGREIRHTDCYIDWVGGSKVHLQLAVDITDIKKITEEKLTAQREAEELAHKKEHAEESSRMKSVFLASMSHEIRTPMHGIIGFSELALDDNIPSKTRNYLSKIKASAESLLLIINDVLDVSKIEAGKMELEKIPFDVNEVFKLCRLISSPQAQEKGLTLFCYAEPSVGKYLLGDPTRLRQILLNLLSNAIKFTNNGMVKLLSEITARTENTITMRFEVRDSGIGMTEDQLAKVFQPFIQADDSTTRKFGGTGLGLTITKSFVELMDGVLCAESSYGLGSKFSFEIEFETVDIDANISNLHKTVRIDEKPVFSGEILVCEDNPLNQTVISDHLSKVGLNSVIAANGRIGLEQIKKRADTGEKQFDLIFMDIHMPEMDGLEAAKRILKMGINTPIVALTANIMSNDIDTYIKAGMRECLSKPFTAHELWKCLLNYLMPVSMTAVNRAAEITEEEEQRKELICAFVKSNQTVFADIKNALSAEDFKLAHRLAHTLKNVAGLVGRKKLSEAAQAVEQSLSSSQMELIDAQTDILGEELQITLMELTALMENFTDNDNKKELTNKENILLLLETLDSLLEADSFDSLLFVNDLRKIPEAEELANLVENMKFKQARTALAELRRKAEYE